MSLTSSSEPSGQALLLVYLLPLSVYVSQAEDAAGKQDAALSWRRLLPWTG